jgi:hypothetical protein
MTRARAKIDEQRCTDDPLRETKTTFELQFCCSVRRQGFEPRTR